MGLAAQCLDIVTPEEHGYFWINADPERDRGSAMQGSIFKAACLAFATYALAGAASATTYTIENINVPGAVQSGNYTTSAAAINNYGEIAGSYYTATGDSHLFTEENNQYNKIDLGLSLGPSVTSAYGYAINDSGTIAGGYANLVGFAAFTLNGSNATSITYPGSPPNNETLFYGENNTGELVGYSVYPRTAFIYSNGNFTQFTNTYFASDIHLSGISDNGIVVGSYIDSSTTFAGFYSVYNHYYYLDVPNSLPGSTVPTGISSNGIIVGTYEDSDRNEQTFVYDNGAYTEFSVAGAGSTRGSGINDKGQIVGVYIAPGGDLWQSFVATPDVAPPPPPPPIRPPVPEPSTWMLLLLGIGSIGAMTRLARRDGRMAPAV